jgi:hypothetical protein
MFTEATTPFINLRWFFDVSGMKSSPLYLINGLIMFVGWYTIRICMQYWMAYNFNYEVYFVVPHIINPFVKLIFIPTLQPLALGLNTYWGYKIGKGFMRAIFPSQKPKQK